MNSCNFTDKEFFLLIKTEEDAIKFAQDVGLIKETVICCFKPMSLRLNNGLKNHGYYLRCNKRECRKEISIRKNTIFEGSHLTITQILMIIYYFINDQTSFLSIKKNTGIKCNETIVEWLNNCRRICLQYFAKHPTVIGGPGVAVEVDEAVLVKRKYNRGRAVRAQWIFCAYEVLSKKAFFAFCLIHKGKQYGQ